VNGGPLLFKADACRRPPTATRTPWLLDTPAAGAYAGGDSLSETGGEDLAVARRKHAKTMSEGEWLACTDPFKLVEFLEERGTGGRRLWLWTCACARRVWHFLTDERSRKAIEVAEAFADGLVDPRQRREAYRAAERASLKLRSVLDRSTPIEGMGDKALHDATLAPYYASIAAERVCLGRSHDHFARHTTWNAVATGMATMGAVIGGPSDAKEAERAVQASVLRCIFGNPFRPITLSPAWQTPAVVALAEAAYGNRIMPSGTLDPDRLAVLADALEETGCDNAFLLEPLRGPGSHVRGCAALDSILGRQ
jgi:hypothetical protein